MTFTDIDNLLAGRLGFDIETIGTRAVEVVIRHSMERAGVSDPVAYGRLLARDSEAWNALVDRLVIPETWFFRDGAPFQLAADLIRAHVGSRSAKIFRVLSCPCSTGEEPYSVAIAMLDAGAPSGSFIVDAVDVSRRALATARAAIFRKRSFRNDAFSQRELYFQSTETDGSWQLDVSVASLVRFQQGNLIAPDFLKTTLRNDTEPYDLIFCRNLLIYLHPEARLLAMAALHRLLAEGGVLVLGHAEATFAREHGFGLTGPPAAFAVVKSPASGESRRQPATFQNPPLSISVRPLSGLTTGKPAAQGAGAMAAASSAAESDESQLPDLIVARRLGDAGRLDEAIGACRDYLERSPDSADGYFLLGVLHDALGNSDLAARDFRKVLYLDPTHREALLHLALKQEALGDASGAGLLRARVRAHDHGANE